MIHRAEVIGSMLRPPPLLRARDEHGAGRVSEAQLRFMEDRAVDECVAIQERAGVSVITDGEMRRNVFASQLAQAVEGFDTVSGNTVDWFTMETFGLHVCRGNDANRFMARGSYAAIAEEVLRRTHARVILLEYDDERSGDFSPLAKTADDKVIVLGLVTTKRPRQETSDEVIARIREASRYLPLERLAVSTQCGFASVAKGNNIPFDVQERKLALVAEVARNVWG